jgi:hypothetical protein
MAFSEFYDRAWLERYWESSEPFFYFFPKNKDFFIVFLFFFYLFFVLAKKKKYDKKLETQLYKTVCFFLKKIF